MFFDGPFGDKFDDDRIIEIISKNTPLLTDPTALASLAVRPSARAAALSSAIQNRLIQGEITPEQANLAKLLMFKGVVGATSHKGKENE